MSLILAFLTKQEYIENAPGQVNEFFELSPVSLSYSKTLAEYQSTSYPGAVLHTFLSKNTATGESITLGATQVDITLAVAKSVYDYCTGIIGPINSAHLTSFVLAQNFNFVQTFTHGSIYEGNRIKLPDWISWKQSDAEQTEVRLWLRNAAFENQYADYETIVVSPLRDDDLFFSNYATIAAALTALTLPEIVDNAQEKTEGYPPTYTRFLKLKFVNRDNPSQSTDAHWGFLIYGKNGDNIDSMKDAIADYLLANSTHTQEEWMQVFPEVFKRTEFLLFPRWDKLSIHNSNPLASLYASIYNVDDMIHYVTRNNPSSYDSSYVLGKMNVLPFDYKAITVAAIPGETNDTAHSSLISVFPDYIPIGTSDVDFNRMTVKTRNWVFDLVNLLVIAETVTEYSSINNPFRRVKRNGQLFVCFLYDNVNYLVSTRSNNLV